MTEDEAIYHIEYGLFNNIAWTIKKIRSYVPTLFLFMIVGMITGSLLSYLWSFIGKFVLDIVQTQSESSVSDISPLVKLLAIVLVIEFLAVGLNNVINTKISYKFLVARFKIMTERITRSLSMDYETLENPAINNTQEKAQHATEGGNNGIEGLMHSMYDSGTQVLSIIVSVITVLALDYRLIIALSIIAIAQAMFMRYTVKKDRREVWDTLGGIWHKAHYMERTTQGFDWAKDIRLFNMKSTLSQKQHDILDEERKKMFHSKNLWMINSAFNGGMGIVANIVVYGVLIYAVVGTDMSIGNFTLYLGLASTFSSALRQLLSQLGTFKQRSMEVDDFRSFVEGDFGVDEDTIEYLPLPKTDKYTFEFKNVSYRYIGADDYSLKNLNLTLKAGQKLAVVGLNGAGKTTFIKLLLRLYDVTEGEILLNGVDIRRYKKSDYYNLFAPVFQNVQTFAFPISENVSMNTPDNTNKDTAKLCLDKAGMGDKINHLTKGVDTELLKILHDDGVDLSGGEKQKLALARALYKDSPIVVLDEPTAALDALAEYNLYSSFNEVIGSKSAVYISHRLSSTRFCDTIAMFKYGEMVEYGTHEELLTKKGDYAQMFEIQSQYYREDGKMPLFNNPPPIMEGLHDNRPHPPINMRGHRPPPPPPPMHRGGF